MHHNVPHTPRLLELKKRRRQAFFGRTFFICAAVLVIFASLVYISRLEQLNISEVRVAGNKVVETEAIKEIVEGKISGHYIWLFPKTNILTYPRSNIKEELQKKFKRLENVNLSLIEEKILEVSVAEREPLYTWCGFELSITNTNTQKCYFVDQEGFIFSEAPYISGEVYFKFYGAVDPTDNEPIGSSILAGNFDRLVLFKNVLTSMGIKPVALYTKDGRDIKIYLSKGKFALNPPEIIFTIDSDLQKLAENLETALSTDPLKSEFKNRYSSLEYIDLRFGNKVYYKFR